jgi:hypothetical protein
VVGAVLVLVAALVGAGLVWWRSQASSELVRATELAPGDAQRLTWTDWRGVRAELGSELDARSSPGEVTDFLDAGFEADLTSTSVLLGSAAFLEAEYGFSPASLDWELLSQSAAGSVVLMRLPDGADLDELRDGFEDLGYERPADADGVWNGGEDLVSRLDPSLTPQLQYLAVHDDERLVLASDTADYLADVTAGLGEEGAPEELDDVLRTAGDQPLSAVVYGGAHVCGELAMGAADAADQAEAEQLLAEAGEVSPMTGYLMAELPGGGIRVAMSFETEEQARTNADTRGALARGPAPGQGGSFADRFRVERVAAEGSVVTMDLDPVEGEYVLSDLSSGPVLFATC